MKILVRTPNWIGDHVMAMPFYASLRKHYSDSHITFLSPEVLHDFKDEEFRDAKITLSSKERKISREFVEKACSLRKEKFDLALSLPSSWSASLFLFLTGAKNRVGFSSEGSGLLYHSFLSWRGNRTHQHKSELYLSLLEFLTGHAPLPISLSRENTLSKENYIVLAPGASLPLREYPYFSELLESLSKNYPDCKIFIVGGKQEEKYKSRIQRLHLSNVEDRIGKTSLQEVIELCRKAKVVLSNDSGVAHLSGTLAKAPTLVLMGPGDPNYILPLGGKSQAVRLEDLPCSPCEKPYCRAPYGYQACLKGLFPERILDKMKSLTL